MRGRLRKLLSFVLVLVLVVQMLPVSAFAEGVILAEGSAPTLAQRPGPATAYITEDRQTNMKRTMCYGR